MRIGVVEFLGRGVSVFWPSSSRNTWGEGVSSRLKWWQWKDNVAWSKQLIIDYFTQSVTYIVHYNGCLTIMYSAVN